MIQCLSLMIPTNFLVANFSSEPIVVGSGYVFFRNIDWGTLLCVFVMKKTQVCLPKIAQVPSSSRDRTCISQVIVDAISICTMCCWQVNHVPSGNYSENISMSFFTLQAGGQEMATPSSQKKNNGYTLASEGGGTYNVAGGEQINVILFIRCVAIYISYHTAYLCWHLVIHSNSHLSKTVLYRTTWCIGWSQSQSQSQVNWQS